MAANTNGVPAQKVRQATGLGSQGDREDGRARARQQAVDRRFNRRRYDTVRTVEAFSAHLRDEMDLDVLGGQPLAVVDQTVQPTTASLWLRSSIARPPREREQASPPSLT